MRLVRRIYRAIFALSLLIIVVAGGLALDIWRYAGQSSTQPADAALVLGAAVLWDRPSPVLVERLRHAKALYDKGQVGRIVVTGGRSPEDKLSEAEASRNWLVANGVPAEAIVEEDQSRTTIENLAFATPVLRQAEIASVLIVSDPLHMRRAMLIAGRAGLNAQPSPTPTSRYLSWQTTMPFLAREVWFMGQYLVAGL
ncbi:multidrug MFS transporter [Devosia yakushimensis]|uniref:Multidrug MFS transporter n=1 Tax=Devosia yakushimensis TaxID=470028 RepID=A0ABQ5UG21_9HYPH|nr:YdcF family protein [Devosia yakushimensis]GLQ11047.1 multidrug MFS transporter [Devosia yakushimensis]